MLATITVISSNIIVSFIVIMPDKQLTESDTESESSELEYIDGVGEWDRQPLEREAPAAQPPINEEVSCCSFIIIIY